MFDGVLAAMNGQLTFRKHEVGALYRVLIRQPVADKNSGRVCGVEKSHHGGLARRTAMSTGLMKVRKLSAPQPTTRFQATCANARPAQKSGHSSTRARQNATNAVVETIANDMRRDVVRGAQFK